MILAPNARKKASFRRWPRAPLGVAARVAMTLMVVGVFTNCSGGGSSSVQTGSAGKTGSGGSSLVGSGGSGGMSPAGSSGGTAGITGGTPGAGGNGGGGNLLGGSSGAAGGASLGGRGGDTGGGAGTGSPATGGIGGNTGNAGSAGNAGNTGNAGNGGNAVGGTGGAGGGIGGSGPGGAAGSRKAFLVGLPTAIPTAGDNVMIGRLTAHGFQVTVVSDKTVDSQMVAGADLVVISSSAESGNLGVRLKDVPIPIFCIENGQYPNQGMTPPGVGVGEGSVFTQTAVAVISPSSPLVGGLTGNVTISTKSGELGWGAPPATATTVATIVGQATHATIFGYAKGDQMVGMTAPARRAGFAIREDLAASLSADGITLFDSILEWVTQ